jgi:putative RecB family exonuclease
LVKKLDLKIRMKQFSHSKLSTYERCPLSFKLQYLTKLKPEREANIEAFLGSRVHDTLELLYRDLLKTKLNSLEDLSKFYDEIWRVEWNDEIVINNENFNKEHYYNLGKKCIKNYYEKYHPFDQDQTLGIEKKINLKWEDVEITGYIDRLSREKKGVYAIHDYKTGSVMEQDYADSDRQLALYSMAVKQNFKEAKEVKLIWHYVAYGEDVISQRTDKELKELKQNMLDLIAEINRAEREDNFPAIEAKCEWCGYWQYCPKKKHLHKVQELPLNEYLKDSGVKLAKKYIELADKRSAINRQARIEAVLIEEEMMKVEEAILKYSKQHGVDSLDGGERIVAITKTLDYAIPSKSGDSERYYQLEKLLKDTAYWPEISSINSTKLSKLLEEDALDKKLKNKIIELAPLEKGTKVSIRKK